MEQQQPRCPNTALATSSLSHTHSRRGFVFLEAWQGTGEVLVSLGMPGLRLVGCTWGSSGKQRMLQGDKFWRSWWDNQVQSHVGVFTLTGALQLSE